MTEIDSLKTAEDYQLIAHILAGNINAYEVVIRRYNQLMFRIAKGIFVDDDEAMDIVQEAHITAYQKLASFKGPKGFMSWIATITRNIALMRLRKSSRLSYQEEEDVFNLIELDIAAEPIHDTIANQQTKATLEQLINALPINYRAIFILSAIEKMAINDIAQILSLEYDVVKVRFYRAKKMLKIEIGQILTEQKLSLYEFAGDRCDNITHNVMAVIKQQSR
ncbi:RNA polymerase sigma factor [Colwellia psychrerythraea]|uniref:RNA polymerase, sigma-24 subunit, RpoE, ECF subfamily n=1 Tax=Colwellia psychrerythraea TaxID=28229 RepID=A0A099KV00_COLPS|nr:RNA polymerase sigma factor [Colwellia psychrerythraea]KGJ94579.1 RNA polymerase, sigma-24 subunit, RpoE, ECF subfamily [Colwellia psychrerythraea]